MIEASAYSVNSVAEVLFDFLHVFARVFLNG